MPIIVPKKILLMSLYFGENLPNWPSIVHFYLRKLYICTILSGNSQGKEHIIFMDIREPLNANNRTETDFPDEPLFWRKSAQLAVYCTFLFKEIVHLHYFIGNHQEGEQIIFMDIRVPLNANNRTETNFSDEPLFWRKSAQLAVYCTFLFKEIVHLHHFIGKSQGKEHIIFMDIREPLNANNRTETDFADEPLFWRKSAQLAVYCTFLFKEIVRLHYFLGKSPGGRANHFHGY